MKEINAPEIENLTRGLLDLDALVLSGFEQMEPWLEDCRCRCAS
jgi:hypothetical protein